MPSMESAAAFIPIDRRWAIGARRELPSLDDGSVLFADISGFTPLIETYVGVFGPRRGADEATRQLNLVYSPLVDEVHRRGGSIVAFSGDGMTCWFTTADDPPDAAAARAVKAAFAIQAAMKRFAVVDVTPERSVSLHIKTTIASGRVRRMLVGDPAIRVIDVVAGAPLDRSAAAEQLAGRGELLVDWATAQLLGPQLAVAEWRIDGASRERFAVVDAFERSEPAAAAASALLGWMETPPPPLSDDDVRPWLLPQVYERMQAGSGRFLAELRPAVALFLRFGGIDYEQEAAPEQLDAYVRWVQRTLDRCGGALIELTTGDKGSYLYLIFGAPLAHDDNALRAAAAARELLSPPAELPVRPLTQIGIAQGRMRVGAYGAASRSSYGVQGASVNLAARLMMLAPAGQALVDGRLAEALAGSYQLEPLGSTAVKGWQAPVAIFALGEGARGASPPSSGSAERLIGRQEELAQMLALLDEVQSGGRGHILRIEGEAGVGKSRLTAAFVARARSRSVTIAAAACQSIERSTPYFVLRQIVRSFLDLDGQEGDTAEQVLQIERRLVDLDASWLPRLPLLGDLLGLPLADNELTAAFDARLRREATVSLAIELISFVAHRLPTVLVVEDAHWLDEASLDVLISLGRVVALTPLLVVLAHRPADAEIEAAVNTLGELSAQSHLLLTPLDGDGTGQLVADRLGGAVDPLVLAVIGAQAQGNPFFCEELVDALREADGLSCDAGGVWRLTDHLIAALAAADCLEPAGEGQRLRPQAPLAAAGLGLPDTIYGSVLARFDRLPEAVKLTLKIASVVGSSFDLELLARAHPDPASTPTLAEQLSLLERRSFALPEPSGIPGIYRFKHSITQEVVYRTLLETQRLDLHQSVGSTLEMLRPDAIEQLAFHFYNSDLAQPQVRRRALHYLDAAIEHARRDFANETALVYLVRALALDEQPTWLAAQVEVLHILGRRSEERAALERLRRQPAAPPVQTALLAAAYHEALGEYPAAAAAVEEALQVCQQEDQPAAAARCLAQLGLIAWRQGDYTAAQERYAAALAALGTADGGDDRVAAEARYGLGLVLRQQGDHEAAKAEFAAALELARRYGDRPHEARARLALGHVESLRRSFEEALDHYQAAVDIYQAIGDRAGIGTGLLSLAQGMGSLGDHGRAEPLLREALRIHQAIANPWSEILIWNELGILNMMVGRLEEAERCLEQGLVLSRRIGDEPGEAYLLCNLGQVQRDRGELHRATLTLQSGLALASAQGDVGLEASAHSDLAIVELRLGNAAAAVEHASAALSRLQELELEETATTDHATLAAALLGIGDRQQAADHAERALTLLKRSGGEGLYFPQRDYYGCARVLEALGEERSAHEAFAAARQLLLAHAERISDPDMRRSFLTQAPLHAEILNAPRPPER